MRVETTPRGMAIIERNSTRDPDRDRRIPKHGPIVATPVFEEITGRFEGEELELARARRPTEERIARLEQKHDSLDEKVDRIDVAVAGIAGQMEIVPALIESLRDELKASRENEHVVLKQTLDIGKHEATARIDTQMLATKAKWKIIAGIFSTATITAVITALASRC